MAEVRIDNIFKDIVETIREPLLVLDSDLKVKPNIFLHDVTIFEKVLYEIFF